MRLRATRDLADDCHAPLRCNQFVRRRLVAHRDRRDALDPYDGLMGVLAVEDQAETVHERHMATQPVPLDEDADRKLVVTRMGKCCADAAHDVSPRTSQFNQPRNRLNTGA